MSSAELTTQGDVFKLPLPKSPKTETVYFDRGKPKDRAKGLGLRVRSDGSRTWVFFYRFRGKLRKLTIGTASDDPSGWTLPKARTKAHRLRVDTDSGLDPVEERHKANAAAQEAKTFKLTYEAYLVARKRSMKPRSYAETKRHLEKVWSSFHRRLVHEITTDMVADRLADIEKQSGAVARNRARSTLSAMFAWALGERFSKQLHANVVIGTIKAAENKPREITLSDDELAAIWKAAPDNGYGRIVKLLMLTGQRRNEIGGLHWSEVASIDDASKAQITLPSHRTKNGRPHAVPLSDLAVGVLKTQPQISKRDLVFGEGAGGYSGWSRSKAELDKVAGLGREWTLHDLRRTAATRMADIGIQPHIIEAVLNHVSGHKAGVAGIYNRSAYTKEKREALYALATHIKTVIARAEGANIHQLKRA